MIIYKSAQEIEKIALSCQLAARVLQKLKDVVEEGLTTLELDRIAEDFIRSYGAEPAFKGYRNYPNTLCTSINHEVVHGIPSKRRLRPGDLLSVDVGVRYDGYYGDGAVTLPVGEVTEQAERLLEVAERALYSGIEAASAGNRLSDISHAVQTYAEARGYSVVREYVGHGIGASLHEEPQVPNYGPPGRGPLLRDGMTLAIEPMVNIGGPETRVCEDNWTVVTADSSLSAHFEHTIVISGEDPRILTRL